MGWQPGEPPSDADLIVESASHADRFGELFDRHADAVVRYFYKRTGCPHTAADLMAETFASAFGSRMRFRDTGAPGRAWLFKIAERQLSRYIRREHVATRARRRLGVDTTVELSAAEAARIEALVDFASVRTALADLPAAQREAVWLRVGQDLAYEDVAARLGCSAGAARARVSRGLDRLARSLEGRDSA